MVKNGRNTVVRIRNIRSRLEFRPIIEQYNFAITGKWKRCVLKSEVLKAINSGSNRGAALEMFLESGNRLNIG